MNRRLRLPLGTLGLLLSLSLNGGIALADTIIAYPNVEEASFTITVPDDWQINQTGDNGEYFLISSPTKVELWFRSMTVSSSEDASATVQLAFTQRSEWFSANFQNIEFDQPIEGEREGLPFISIPGKGVAKGTNNAYSLVIAFIMMRNGMMAEFSSVASLDDEAGKAAVQAVIDSFKAR